MTIMRWIALGAALLGAVFVAVGVSVGVSRQNRAEASRAAPGVVVDQEYERDSDGGGGYIAVVRFTTADGREITIRSQVRSRPPAFDVGESVSVLYDPENPNAAVIDSFLERWFLPALFVGLGGLFSLLGFGGLAWFWVAGRQARLLRESGLRLRARVIAVDRNPGVTINGVPAWRVMAEWIDPATGRPRAEPSANLAFDPRRWLADEVDVYLDRENGRRFLIDLSPVENAYAGQA